MSDEQPENPTKNYSVLGVSKDSAQQKADLVVTEEPLEIRILFGPSEKRTMRNISITMRTPGHDKELAAGFLASESILQTAQQIDAIQVRGVDSQGKSTGNIVRVELVPNFTLELGRLQRHFFTTSSCGVCGKASLEALAIQGLKPITDDGFQINWAAIRSLPSSLKQQQETFHQTGGLHGAGLADSQGHLKLAREDVGRHNAVDKLIGRMFLNSHTPLTKYAMIVSGRVSFEIMQKALVAGLPVVVAVGAPSSLAIDMAIEYNITLIGFASADRFNVYAGGHRVVKE